ncbi:stage II sporulation protein D [Virgibacillus ainsalahensis]
MKKHKNTYKTVSKIMKKKQATRLKQEKPKQHASKPKKMKTIEHNAFVRPQKPKYLGGSQRISSRWKLPVIFFLSSLMMILVLPTLIVIPFGESGEEKGESNVVENAAEVEEGPDPSEQSAESDAVDSSFSVAVMRNTSDTVENVDLESYVAGVVASEMNANFEMEALKAQSLAARTYIVNHVLYQDKEGSFDVTDTVQHQVYKNEEELKEQWGSDFPEKMNKIKKAVAATEGEIITYNDAPISVAFFSTSNGYTENSEDYWDNELPYLRSVESPWDEASPKFLDQETFSIGEVEKALEVDLPHETAVAMELTRTESKRVRELGIGGNSFSGREVREKLGLRSSDFTIEQKNEHLIFTTKGYGHGIGMSQYGAEGMAKEGKNYQEIVNYYYQDIEISTVNDTAPTLVAK